MQAAALEGGFAEPAPEAARVFRAALDAMARPGTVHRIAGVAPPAPLGVAAGALALTLCDGDTGVWLAPSLDAAPVRDWLRFHAGARLVDRAQADFAFGPWAELAPLDDFRAGEPAYPDRSATLVVAMPALGAAHRLTGPGIETEAWLTVPDPAALRANAARHPLGVDLFLTCGDRLAALPRTTRVEG